jgi:catechol 2,3-dioxygenase-like lactoylglutathione lyase family enzyme
MLQNAPMYSYIPAKDVARARAFYEEKLGFKPKDARRGSLRVCQRHSVFSVSDAQRRHFESEPSLLAG